MAIIPGMVLSGVLVPEFREVRDSGIFRVIRYRIMKRKARETAQRSEGLRSANQYRYRQLGGGSLLFLCLGHPGNYPDRIKRILAECAAAEGTC